MREKTDVAARREGLAPHRRYNFEIMGKVVRLANDRKFEARSVVGSGRKISKIENTCSEFFKRECKL